MSIWKSLYLHKRLYWLLSLTAVLFFFGVFLEPCFVAGIILLAMIATAVAYDFLQLFHRQGTVTAQRNVGDRLSNGDENQVTIDVRSGFREQVYAIVIDELPVQFQRRDLSWDLELLPGQARLIRYNVRPVRRGEYRFGALIVLVRSRLSLIMRKYTFSVDKAVKVYPSYLQLRHFAFLAFDKRLQDTGIKRIRRLGHTLEFEQIKEYVTGDDTRVMNWKATARTGKPMVNQFQDERAQPIYCVIDKGRLMKMPFEEMTLLDYAINATLVMSYIAIHKSDKAGLITFSHVMEDVVPAGRRSNQMYRITEALYKQTTDFKEANYERLTAGTIKKVRNRSLLILMTNFESLTGLKRQLPYLKLLAERHVVVVIFFRNTAIEELTEHRAKTLRQIYHQTVAEKTEYEKETMVRLLRSQGIYAVLTTPKELTVDTINQYLALKARNVI